VAAKSKGSKGKVKKKSGGRVKASHLNLENRSEILTVDK